LITKANLQPFVVTLCGLLIYRGLSRTLTGEDTQRFEAGNGVAQNQLPPQESLDLMQGRIDGMLECFTGKLTLFEFETANAFGATVTEKVQLPYSLFFMVALAIIAAIFLNKTIWGRYMFAVGRNEDAARYSGISATRTKIAAYVICSTIAGIAGMLFAMDVGSVQPPQFGNFYELYAIAGAVLGGCSLRGGEGSIVGVIIGATVMRVLYNAINMLGIPNTLEFIVIGGVLLIGVIADEFIRIAAERKTG
jgi:ribose transport system permease protein